MYLDGSFRTEMGLCVYFVKNGMGSIIRGTNCPTILCYSAQILVASHISICTLHELRVLAPCNGQIKPAKGACQIDEATLSVHQKQRTRDVDSEERII